VSYGVTVDTKVSGNTVFFRAIEWSIPTGGNLVTPTIVTFNTVTKHIKITNLSTINDCYVDLRCIDSSGTRGHLSSGSCVVLVPALGRQSPNTVEFDFATRNLGFIGGGSVVRTNNDNNKVHYVVTGDWGDF
jgi:hypothetical protein